MVDELARRARAAGATLTKEPTDAEFFEGRDAYFADPEGNYWEIAWAPDTNPVVAAARRAASQLPPETPPPYVTRYASDTARRAAVLHAD